MSTERRAKRLRANPPPASDYARNRYLDTVPDEILRIVLRYLSDRPQHQNWHAYTSAFSVNTALDVGGALKHAALLEFDSIGGEDGIVFDTTLDAPILRPLVFRLPLYRLVLELRKGEVLPDLLWACGGELRELVLNRVCTVLTEIDILGIATYCTKLSWLAIHESRVEGTLALIWRSLGSALTRLYISCYSPFSAAGCKVADIISAPDLVKHCVNLRRVDVEALNDSVVDALRALGSRIRVLGIGNEFVSSMWSWHKVYRACTNLEAVHLALHSSVTTIYVLSLLRTKLVSLTLYHLHYLMPTEHHFFSVLSACSRLKKFELSQCSLPLEALRKLFESLKSVRTIACNMRFSNVNPSKDIINVIACNVTNLESLTISTREPLKGEDVNALVGLPHLKYVTLRQLFAGKWDSQPLERCAVEVVKKFKDCAQLVRLEIAEFAFLNQYRRWDRSRLIAEAATTYKRKDFDMFIGGVQYRTW